MFCLRMLIFNICLFIYYYYYLNKEAHGSGNVALSLMIRLPVVGGVVHHTVVGLALDVPIVALISTREQRDGMCFDRFLHCC